MKYFKHKKTSVVYGFEMNGTEKDFITKDMIAMTDDETDRHINPQKYFTDEENQAMKLSLILPLNRYQFRLALHESKLIDDLESKIKSIKDPKTKMRVQITYEDSQKFERTNESVIYMLSELLSLTLEQVDEFWEKAANL